MPLGISKYCFYSLPPVILKLFDKYISKRPSPRISDAA